ncbi:MAG: cupredoxin domain-containing protein [Actinomycetota bacterium]
MSKHRARTTAATMAVVALVLGGLGVGPASAAETTSTTTTKSKAKAAVTVGDNFFKPSELEVTAGTKVTWKNKGKILHNVVAVKAKFGTKALTTGKDYSYRFKKPGTYAYYCSFHGSPTSGQRGSVTVVAAAKATTTTTTVPAG